MAESILAQYTKSGQLVVVGGFWSWRRSSGALNAGLNVVAIERAVCCHCLQHALLRPLLQHGADPSTPRVWSPNGAPLLCLCKSCNNNFTEETLLHWYGDGGCLSCFTGSPVLYAVCQAIPEVISSLSGLLAFYLYNLKVI